MNCILLYYWVAVEHKFNCSNMQFTFISEACYPGRLGIPLFKQRRCCVISHEKGYNSEEFGSMWTPVYILSTSTSWKLTPGTHWVAGWCRRSRQTNHCKYPPHPSTTGEISAIDGENLRRFPRHPHEIIGSERYGRSLAAISSRFHLGILGELHNDPHFKSRTKKIRFKKKL